MGQCMSRKAAGAFAASAAAAHRKPSDMKKGKYVSSDEDNKEPIKKSANAKGAANSFGFKRRLGTAPSVASNATAARRLAEAADDNGNEGGDTEPLVSERAASLGRSTPRLPAPRRETSAATRGSRFGFRQASAGRTNRVADLNAPPPDRGSSNNNRASTPQQQRPTSATPQNKLKLAATSCVDSNRNKTTKAVAQTGKFTLQTSHLPKPQTVKVYDSKAAKTQVNNSVKVSNAAYNQTDDNSSKDGSLTEDSGVDSHAGTGMEDDLNRRLDNRSSSASRRSYQKLRSLDVVLNGNTFDVRDSDDGLDTAALPKLPSVFDTSEKSNSAFDNMGLVRERAHLYQRNVEMNTRKISISSSDGFSDNSINEKSYKDKYRDDKTFKVPSHKMFLKPIPPPPTKRFTSSFNDNNDNKSLFSSKDELKVKEAFLQPGYLPLAFRSSFKPISPKHDFKNITLTIEDSKFIAVAAESRNNTLLTDETSPVDSLLSFSESEEVLKDKRNESASNSKDINEKLTPTSPGTPTNASNSLSLSEGKDDFLIDDEIADQPGLVLEDTLTNSTRDLFQNGNMQEGLDSTTVTLLESTPKPKSKRLSSIGNSPLFVRSKRFLQSSTVSLDTLSPCESIASDDLMMDYDYSQSSGLDDFDRTERKLDETIIVSSMETDQKNCEAVRDWSALLNSNARTTNGATRTRFLRSRTGTPNSVCDSPSSLDSKLNGKAKPVPTNSPLRYPRPGPHYTNGCENDGFVKTELHNVKSMLYQLKRVLTEQACEETLLRCETHVPFESQLNKVNGLLNGYSSTNGDLEENEAGDGKLELSELKRQVLFLQGQLEDKDRTVQSLQSEIVRIANQNYISNSAPASTVGIETNTCNAATQTERVRPVSTGPVLNGSHENTPGSLVSATEARRIIRPIRRTAIDPPKPTTSIWRKMGEPPSPAVGPPGTRRANSRSRLTPSVVQ